MIVSPTRKLIFVHIPKTGGRSVETALRPVIDKERDVHISHGNWQASGKEEVALNPDVKLTKHAPARQIRRAVGARDYPAYFSFAIVRNPYARIYSAFRFVRDKAGSVAHDRIEERKPQADPSPNQPDISQFADMEFDEFCADLTANATKLGVFKPLNHWVHAQDAVSFVGRLEQIETDMGHVFDKLGLAQPDPVPHRNKTTAGGSWRDISGASIDAIRAHYADDFERFGYSVDLDAPLHSHVSAQG